MGTQLDRKSYQKLIDEDIAELEKHMPLHSLEKKHAIEVLKWSVDQIYGKPKIIEVREDLKELTSKITPENLLLLNYNERNDESILTKLLAWQEDYNYVSWFEFQNWIFCDVCGSYDDQPCICYAR